MGAEQASLTRQNSQQVSRIFWKCVMTPREIEMFYQTVPT